MHYIEQFKALIILAAKSKNLSFEAWQDMINRRDALVEASMEWKGLVTKTSESIKNFFRALYQRCHH